MDDLGAIWFERILSNSFFLVNFSWPYVFLYSADQQPYLKDVHYPKFGWRHLPAVPLLMLGINHRPANAAANIWTRPPTEDEMGSWKSSDVLNCVWNWTSLCIKTFFLTSVDIGVLKTGNIQVYGLLVG